MSLANAVCPPHAWDAFSTGFMSQIKPQVEFKINLKCVEPSGSRGYSLRMETRLQILALQAVGHAASLQPACRTPDAPL